MLPEGFPFDQFNKTYNNNKGCLFYTLQKDKCDQYWPDEITSRTYGDVTVTSTCEDVYADFIHRTFTVERVCITVMYLRFLSFDKMRKRQPEMFVWFVLEKRVTGSIYNTKRYLVLHSSVRINFYVLETLCFSLTKNISIRFVLNALKCIKGKQKRILHQMHYTSWPDRSVPHDVTTLVFFWHRVTSLQRKMKGTIVVHCRLKIFNYAFRKCIYYISLNNPNRKDYSYTPDNKRYIYHKLYSTFGWYCIFGSEAKKGNHHILHSTVPKCGHRTNRDVHCPGHTH